MADYLTTRLVYFFKLFFQELLSNQTISNHCCEHLKCSLGYLKKAPSSGPSSHSFKACCLWTFQKILLKLSKQPQVTWSCNFIERLKHPLKYLKIAPPHGSSSRSFKAGIFIIVWRKYCWNYWNRHRSPKVAISFLSGY